jgi:hypothetical protein
VIYPANKQYPALRGLQSLFGSRKYYKVLVEMKKRTIGRKMKRIEVKFQS